ncbi:hypothetical protein NPIL_543651 [Nephila pilipes]|uniref:Uncharacterized protein n=1 Tax=Nephila pilipes TaxID=299642 RepID=A0A8X6MUW0_NEPPI|nr:hypothetical protein NPIL_543651 [Nephila pilipes]
MLEKNEEAILKSFKVFSETPESIPESSDVSSLKASAAQNQEESEVINIPDTNDLLGPAIESMNLSTSRASDAIAEIGTPEQTKTTSTRSGFVGYDTEKWPKI